jgi:hypothetical protein
MPGQSEPTWVPLKKLRAQFDGNLAALRKQDGDLADELAKLQPEQDYFLRTEGDLLMLGRRAPGASDIEVLTNILPAARARDIAAKIFPAGRYTQPLAIAGLDQGWLWEAMYKLPCHCAHAPGMRFPLYLLAGNLERLWAVLHYQNWTQLLADARVRVVAGPEAVAGLREMLLAEPKLCVPRMSVTVEAQLWTEGLNLDAIVQGVATASASRLSELQRKLAASVAAGNVSPGNGPLRILGITSRYTTFLQHSMRDWLGALEKMGHQTRLLIEQADHEIMPATAMAEECLAFRPDLIVIIDHYRGEMPGLPRHVPCVMWVQDRLPNIYASAAGAAQESNDFVIGYGRPDCTRKWGYPPSRFLPAMVGVNEERFAPRQLTRGELAEYACDVSFVSHASVPAERLVEQECRRADNPQTRRLLENVHDRLRVIYDAGDSVTEPAALTAIIDAALAETRLQGDSQSLLDFVSQRINNALLRHQAIRWAVQAGADVRLYGRGWEEHPEFARFARGPADNQNQLALIYQASRVNLQVTPFGAAHQRMFEGLACGGFFLMRAVTGDAIDVMRREVWRWCWREGVSNAEEMVRAAGRSPGLQWLLSGMSTMLGAHSLSDPEWFYAGLEEAALFGFSRSAATLWPEFGQVSFWSQAELTKKLKHFLSAENERRTISASMRDRVLQWHTYTAISKRMLSFIAGNQAAGQTPVAQAA